MGDSMGGTLHSRELRSPCESGGAGRGLEGEKERREEGGRGGEQKHVEERGEDKISVITL